MGLTCSSLWLGVVIGCCSVCHWRCKHRKGVPPVLWYALGTGWHHSQGFDLQLAWSPTRYCPGLSNIHWHIDPFYIRWAKGSAAGRNKTENGWKGWEWSHVHLLCSPSALSKAPGRDGGNQAPGCKSHQWMCQSASLSGCWSHLTLSGSGWGHDCRVN